MKTTTPTIIIICVVIVVFVQTRMAERMVSNSFPSHMLSKQQQSATASSTRLPRLGDGCYHVFLDVGSNIGIHGRFLYEPHQYPESKSSVAAFAREFGTDRDNRDFCVFAFEPNPQFETRHLELSRAYSAMGWRYHPIFAGASNSDGNMTFYHTHMVDTPHADKELGFSAVARKTLYGKDSKPKTVSIIRLASWIMHEIRDRKIPDTPHSVSSLKPKVVMKLDVEGIEYKVFPDLLLTGALCDTIDLLIGEFHYGPGNHNMFPMNITSDGKQILHHRKEGQKLAQELLRVVEISENCKTVISLDDDESYGADPVEFPKP